MSRSPKKAALVASAALAATATGAGYNIGDTIFIIERPTEGVDSLGRSFIVIEGDTLHTSFIPDPFEHKGPLTDADFEEIAKELDVEVAAIKAIVEIETGKTHKGFYAEGKPIINYDRGLFRRMATRRGVNLAPYASSVAFQSLNVKKYGGQQAAQQARLDAAMAIDSIAAMECTFWGMFQIGGFNWKLCGAPSREAFLEKMSKSEYDQLRLFADYMSNTGLVKYLRDKNWAAFARIYNGPSYAARGYHTRMAAAYRKYSAQRK